MSPQYAVILFHTDAAVFRSERLLAKAGIAAAPIPTPRELSSDCGLALRVPRERADEAVACLRTARVDVASFHDLP